MKRLSRGFRKALVGFMAAAAVFGLGACIFEKNEKDNTQEITYEELVVVYPGSYGQSREFREVQARINEITREKLGIQVQFQVIDNSGFQNKVELMLTGGEQLDILCGSNGLFMNAYLYGQLWDLEEALTLYGQGIVDAVGWDTIDCCRIDGVLFGLPNNRDYAAGWDSYALRRDLLDKYGIHVQDIKTVEDLEEIFDLIKEKEPEVIPLACSGSLMSNFALSDGINSFPAGGHENYGQSEQVVNIFETEEYIRQLNRIRSWYLKGYVGTEILENAQSSTDMIRTGEAFAKVSKNKPGMNVQESLACQREVEIVQLGPSAVSYNSMAAFPWMITKNTVSLELSMKLLNLLYTNEEIMNLLAYGIQGTNYVKTQDGHITLPEGVSGNPFVGTAWMMPNQFITYVWEGNPLDLWEQMRQYNKNALQSCEIGFNFNVSPVADEYLKLEEIYGYYKPVLESGLVDPKEGLEQMLAELKENGLDKVIAEKQRQFSKWQRKHREK